MKANYKNSKNIFKSIFIVALLITTISTHSFASNGNDNKNKESKIEESLITELLLELDDTDALQIQEETIEIFDANDQLIFSGTQQAFTSLTKKDKKLLSFKRNAELLFEMDGSKIFKLF